MKKILKICLILAITGIIAAGAIALYMIYKPHRNIAKEKPAYILEAKQLFSEFSTNEKLSNEKYINQVIQLTGNVVDVNITENTATIAILDEMEGINCSFDSATVAKSKDEISKIAVGDTIQLKGQCDGYDMIMGVVLTRCVLVKE